MGHTTMPGVSGLIPQGVSSDQIALQGFIYIETSFVVYRRATRSPVVIEVFYFHVFLRRILAFFVYVVLRTEIRVRSRLLLTLSPVKG